MISPDSKYKIAGEKNFGVYHRVELPVNEQHHFARRFVDLLPGKGTPYQQILFLACGNGNADYPVALAAETRLGPIRPVFLDLQREPILDLANRYFNSQELDDYTERLTFIDGSMPTFARWDMNATHRLPFEDETVAGVYFRNAMHWLEYPFFVMRELARVLKPGGVGYIATATPYSLTVMNETFDKTMFSRDEIEKMYPTAQVTTVESAIYQKDVWVVSHASEIESCFAQYPHNTWHQRVKASRSMLGGKIVTGFLPGYFLATAKSCGLDVLGCETEVSPGFANQFDPPDPRSQTGIHVLLGKEQ